MSEASLNWICIKCETINPEAESHCEVCGLERLYRKPEVDHLVAETAPRTATSPPTQYIPVTPKEFVPGPPQVKSIWIISLVAIALLIVGSVLLNHYLHSSTQNNNHRKYPFPSSDNTVLTAKNAQAAKDEVDAVQSMLISLSEQQDRGSLTHQKSVSTKVAVIAKCKTALSYTEQAINEDKTNKEAWIQRVAAFYYMADYKGATQCLAQAKTLFPGSKDFDPLEALVKRGLRKHGAEHGL